MDNMENMGNKAACTPGYCPCPHHKIIPTLLIIGGLIFLLQAFMVLDEYTVAVIWPILVIIGGIVKFTGHSCKCRMKHC